MYYEEKIFLLVSDLVLINSLNIPKIGNLA